MAEYGLQTWDENGNPQLRITDRITRFLGEIDTGVAAGVHVDGRLSLGTPLITVRDANVYDLLTVPPAVSVDNGQISWSFPAAGPGRSPRSVRIAYGVY